MPAGASRCCHEEGQNRNKQRTGNGVTSGWKNKEDFVMCRYPRQEERREKRRRMQGDVVYLGGNGCVWLENRAGTTFGKISLKARC